MVIKIYKTLAFFRVDYIILSEPNAHYSMHFFFHYISEMIQCPLLTTEAVNIKFCVSGTVFGNDALPKSPDIFRYRIRTYSTISLQSESFVTCRDIPYFYTHHPVTSLFTPSVKLNVVCREHQINKLIKRSNIKCFVLLYC